MELELIILEYVFIFIESFKNHLDLANLCLSPILSALVNCRGFICQVQLLPFLETTRARKHAHHLSDQSFIAFVIMTPKFV